MDGEGLERTEKELLTGCIDTDSLQKATNAYNEKSHSYLMGSAPDDVKNSKALQYELDKMNGQHILHNSCCGHTGIRMIDKATLDGGMGATAAIAATAAASAEKGSR